MTRKKHSKKVWALLLAAAVAVTPVASAMPAYAEEAATQEEVTIASVEAMIGELPVLAEVTNESVPAIQAALAAYEQLSAEDQKTIDSTMGTKSSQSYGRDLETAVWGMYALETVDNTTTLADGTYNAETTPALTTTYSKGKSDSSRQKPWALKDITVKNGKVLATVTVESSSYTYIRTNGQKYEKTNTSGNSEFANVPVDLNNTMYIAAYSTSMKGEIAFTVTNSIEEPIVTKQVFNPANITNNTSMFKVVDAYLDGGILYLTLNGSGYRELYKGTYDEAMAAEDDSEWIVGTVREDGNGFDEKYQFAIPVEENETYIQIQALSNSKKPELWWYPRYIKIDTENMTLETGDYEETFDLAVTNNVKMFAVTGATMTVKGGPRSNSYAVTAEVSMKSDSFLNAYVGTAEEAESAESTIALSDTNTFTIPVETIVGTGAEATIDSINGQSVIISFFSKKNQSWYERVFLFDKNARTLEINEVKYADYTAVEAALDSIPADLSIYTEESVAALEQAKENIQWELYADAQGEVDAMAEAINSAIAGLTLKAVPKDEWIKSGSRWWYRHADGSYTTSNWEYINGKWYYFDAAGWMVTGWVYTGGKWYYMNSNGSMATGWVYTGGKWYYMNSNGSMATGWVYTGGKWYYMNTSGAMVTGWIQVKGKWYYMESNGAMAASKWIGKYYVDANGVWVK